MDKSAILKEIQNIHREGFLQKESRFLKSWRQYLCLDPQTMGSAHQQFAAHLQGKETVRVSDRGHCPEGGGLD